MKYYRYDSTQTTNGVSVWLQTHQVIKQTPKGTWIDVYGKKRFILKSARKHYTCETIELAKESFIARKNRQIRILKHQLRNAQLAIEEINENAMRSMLE